MADNLQVYRDILAVRENWDSPSKDTPAQSALREWVETSVKNRDQFFGKMIMTAAEKLERFNPTSDEAEIREEMKSIGELKTKLNKLVQEAKNDALY